MVTFLAGQDLTAASLNLLAGGPTAQLRQTTAQTLPSAAFTAITFDSESVDTDNGHSNVTNNSRYTIPTTGYYMLAGAVAFTSNTSGFRACRWALNGTSIPGSQLSAPASTVAGAEQQLAARVVIALFLAADFVQLQAYQESGGGTLNTGTGGSDGHSTMSVSFLRA